MKQQLFYATTFAVLVTLNLNARADQVITDEVLVWGVCASRAGACTNGESFLPPALTGSIAYKSKDNRTGIWFDDTDIGDADWIIFMDDLADVTTDVSEAFHIFNDENDSIPLIIENGAGTNLLYLDANERIGINTNVPAEELDIRSSLPAIRLDDTDSGAGLVDLQMSTNEFAIEGNSSQDIVEIDTRAPASSLTINEAGKVGIGGTADASLPLRLRRSDGQGSGFKVVTQNAPNNREWFFQQNAVTGAFLITPFEGGDAPLQVFPGEGFTIRNTLVLRGGRVGVGTNEPQGKLDVNGSIYLRGSLLHPDYVFESDYELESIEEHASYMWEHKHLPAIGKGQYSQDGEAVIELGARSQGMLEELEKAHIYIEMLDKRLNQLQEIVQVQAEMLKAQEARLLQKDQDIAQR